MSKKTNRTVKAIIGGVLSVAILAVGIFLLRDVNMGILAPAGNIATEQRNLILWTSLLSLVVVIPVFVMTFYIVWKYRASNRKAKYEPTMHTSAIAETIWWVVPLILITILAVITWISTHKLDPYRALASSKQPITIQVVALNWKWLFIYPEHNIATVNYVQLPVDRPVQFDITADAPMNSFWIPQLGGQVYAMAGMQTELNLQADKLGTYRGSSANLSGEGFAGMTFQTKVTSEADFNAWVASVKRQDESLSKEVYAQLAQPSQNNRPAYYASPDPELYDTILMKYMTPGGDAQSDDKHHDAAHDAAHTHHDAGSTHH